MCQKVAKKPASWNFHFPKMFEKWFYFPTKIHQDVDRRGCVVRLKFAIELNSDTIIRTQCAMWQNQHLTSVHFALWKDTEK